ncbi:hypothetical protein PCL_11539 [Purpureocillium lilacinum]|uniref:Cell surface protein (Mas1) n=1 Tax=Purpureocillium lilacinum TaxID=33203 RepID=A0A2U3EAB6_PURLI|nr:hypothetical protein PCL_11539 [Purpureocillium lilacinum]
MRYSYNTVLAAALAAVSPLVEGHGIVSKFTGDQSGSMPMFDWIRNAAEEGPVARTEIGSPVQNKNLRSVGLGVTTAYGRTKVESGFARAMAYEGSSVPKVRTDGNGWIGGDWHVVTSVSLFPSLSPSLSFPSLDPRLGCATRVPVPRSSVPVHLCLTPLTLVLARDLKDGGGPLRAIIDTTGKGDFRQGIELENVVQVPGRQGEIRKQGGGDGGNAGRNNIVSKLFARFGSIEKRAVNINQTYPFQFKIPADLDCTGKIGNETKVCLCKVVNTSNAGPFGSVAALQPGTEGQNSTSGTAPGDNNNGGSTDDNSLTGPAKDTKGPASPAPGAGNGSPNGGNKNGGTDDNTIDGGGNNNKNGNDKLRVRAARRALPVVAASGHHSEAKGHSKDKVRRFFTA